MGMTSSLSGESKSKRRSAEEPVRKLSDRSRVVRLRAADKYYVQRVSKEWSLRKLDPRERVERA